MGEDRPGPPRPTRLEFRLEDGKLRGFDPDNGVEYLVAWVCNGQYSHWSLSYADDPERGFYVYSRDDSALRESIYRAEMRLIYGVVEPHR